MCSEVMAVQFSSQASVGGLYRWLHVTLWSIRDFPSFILLGCNCDFINHIES